ncbi:ABC transporter substrate-binding protein [Oceanospirillum beijerinckii]|uniref:ABC transporter substrate-binding protein n=1 Tax=Oceanospirillum beijerinckii TaxID=64976 RepID=UPI0003F749BE|nr:ABC transporter substrate-binding protein [Oceanospirillum beijerinckii]
MSYPKRSVLALIFCVFCIAPTGYASQHINVGLTSVQPPFVINPDTEQGLVYDFVGFLNKKQDKYHFSARLIPVKRLLATDKYMPPDLIAFSNIGWGWTKRGGLGSLTLTEGRDLFFSLTESTNPENKGSLAAVRGFHYAFASFSSKNLAKIAHVRLVTDELAVLRLVEHGRTEQGIASESLLNWIAASEPERYKQFSINPKEDHSYNRQFIVLPESPISIDEFNALLLKLKGPEMDQLFAHYGLQSPPLTPYP